nr:hypothetical protein [Actinomycetota bacterium]
QVACVVTRAPGRLAADGGWGAATVSLPPGAWSDVLTRAEVGGPDSGPVACADLFAVLPVALLERR